MHLNDMLNDMLTEQRDLFTDINDADERTLHDFIEKFAADDTDEKEVA